MKKISITFLILAHQFTGFCQSCEYSIEQTELEGLFPEETGSYVLVYDSQFENSANLDETQWMIIPDRQGYYVWGEDDTHGNLEYNSLDNASIESGKLLITSKKEDVIEKAVSWRPEYDTLNDGLPNLRQYNYTSSSVWSKKAFHYGKFEIKCKLPEGKGLFPAFWLFPHNKQEMGYNYPTDFYEIDDSEKYEEIDVFEFSDHFTWKSWPRTFSPEFEPVPLHPYWDVSKMRNHDWSTNSIEVGSCTEQFFIPQDLSENMHTYTLIWTPYRIEWYLDGYKRRTIFKYELISFMLDLEWTPYFNDNDDFTPTINDGSINDSPLINTDNWLLAVNRSFPEQPMKMGVNTAVEGGLIYGGPSANSSWLSLEPNAPPNSTLGTFEIEYIKYWKKIENCTSPQQLDASNINIDPYVYNVYVGSNISIDNFEMQASQSSGENPYSYPSQLTLIATNNIELGPGFDSGNNIFETIIDSELCTKNLSTNNGKKLNEKNVEITDLLKEKFTIFPNPNEGYFTIDFNTKEPSNYIIHVKDQMGRVILSKKSSSYNSCPIDLSNQSAGVYFVQFQNIATGKVSLEKVIIE